MATTTSPVTEAARAMDALRRLVHALHAANARAEGSLRVTAAQLFVLRQIADAPAISLSGLAERTRSAQSSVSEVVSRLVSDGYVLRRAARDDARRVELTLSASGKAIAARAGDTIQERLVAAFEQLPVTQQERVAQGLEEWLAAAGLEALPARFFLEREG